MIQLIRLTLLFITIIICSIKFSWSLSDEKRLIKLLIDNYTHIGRIGRPVRNQSETSRVEFGLHLIQILDLDEKNQVLTTNVWCRYKWHDHYLAWTEAEFNGVNTVRIPIEHIWKPDFVLYNYVGERFTVQSEAMAVISSDGTVVWIPPAILKSTCEIDATTFPFDQQKCAMKFGSWTYNRHALDPFFFDHQEFLAMEDYVPSNEWTILEHWAQKNIKIYECCPDEQYPDLTFFLRLHRKATFYNYILILPSILLSLFTLVMFLLPPEAPAKISLGINIIAAFFLLLLLLSDATPTASHRIPLIGAYYCFNMIITTVSTFMCAVVVNLHYGADKRDPPPQWLRKTMIDWAARVSWIPVPKLNRAPLPLRLQMERDLREMEHQWLMSATTSMTISSAFDGSTLASNKAIPPMAYIDDTQPSMELNELREIKRFVKQYIHKLQTREEIKKSAIEWRVISRVLDRAFFVFYFLCMVVSCLAFFLHPMSVIIRRPLRYAPNATMDESGTITHTDTYWHNDHTLT